MLLSTLLIRTQSFHTKMFAYFEHNGYARMESLFRWILRKPSSFLSANAEELPTIGLQISVARRRFSARLEG